VAGDLPTSTPQTLQPLWTPSAERVARTALAAWLPAASAHARRPIGSYWDLHRWSVEEPQAFWSFYLASSGIPLRSTAARAMSGDPMPRTRWFEGATLNYAHALLQSPAWSALDAPAIIALDEAGRERTLDRATLVRDVARAAAALERDGIGPGDRVAAFASNVPETVILLLACASIGAIFSSCSPDFGFDAAYARFHQIEPKLLVAADGYHYNGKRFETRPVVDALADRLSGRPRVVWVRGDDDAAPAAGGTSWSEWLPSSAGEPRFATLPFDHPLYVLYSSGTTGLPKAMVHRAGGALLTHHKEHRIHSDIGPGDRVLYFTTCGWMMWNWLVSALAQGATIVLFEGSPSHPSLETLWRAVDRLAITHFGTSARFLHACKSAALAPRAFGAYASLRSVLSTGSPLSASGFEWVYRAVGDDLHLASISGGTDIVGCFMLGVPTEPVYAGQIQGPGLGVDLAAFDADGRPVEGSPGELVCRAPLPSMPLRFWNDPDGARYHDAYFSVYDGVWRHGDLVEITPQRGIVVYGRSDATLNPGGVRIGTAEIYRPLETIPEIADALAVGKRDGDDEVIWLFVVLQAGVSIDPVLEGRIAHVIRSSESPRHVPRRLFQVSQLPRTRSGKTMEIAVSRLVNGQEVPNREVVANPESLDEIARVIAAS
jgi:acetoacetyl-CoA synthetase